MSAHTIVALSLAVGFLPQMVNACRPAYECARFSSPRIRSGDAYSAPLQRGLTFRLHTEYDEGQTQKYGGQAWHIVVAPSDRRDTDYLWLVSSPVGTARHLMIGPAFGWTAEESLKMTPRLLRFVLNEEDYRAAEVLNKEIIATFDSRTAERERLGKGTLTLEIARFERTGNAIHWIELKGESCVPQ
jgi:hypothetical protein